MGAMAVDQRWSAVASRLAQLAAKLNAIVDELPDDAPSPKTARTIHAALSEIHDYEVALRRAVPKQGNRVRAGGGPTRPAPENPSPV